MRTRQECETLAVAAAEAVEAFQFAHHQVDYRREVGGWRITWSLGRNHRQIIPLAYVSEYETTEGQVMMSTVPTAVMRALTEIREALDAWMAGAGEWPTK